MSKIKPRYKHVQTGIRRDLWSGKFVAKKSIQGKAYQKVFKSLKKAKEWRNEFHPLLENYVDSKKKLIELNGRDNGYTFGDIWEKYKEIYLHEERAKNTIRVTLERGENFYSELLKFRMVELNPEVIDNHLDLKKRLAILKPNSSRYSFDEELKKLKALLNWYIENYDYKFVNPVLKRHKIVGRIRKKEKRDKKLSSTEVNRFFCSFSENDLMYRDLAIVQFYIAGRISEVAGLTSELIFFDNNYLEIRYVSVWGKDKRFLELKDLPKNEVERYCYFPKVVRDILAFRIERALPFGGHKFLFHNNEKPLSYREIQYQYNKALKRAELANRVSSTHFLRHSMANITRRVTGSLDATQAVTGHRDQKIVDTLYSNVPKEQQRLAVAEVEKHFQGLGSELIAFN